jgi:hypothetical protein
MAIALRVQFLIPHVERGSDQSRECSACIKRDFGEDYLGKEKYIKRSNERAWALLVAVI